MENKVLSSNAKLNNTFKYRKSKNGKYILYAKNIKLMYKNALTRMVFKKRL